MELKKRCAVFLKRNYCRIPVHSLTKISKMKSPILLYQPTPYYGHLGTCRTVVQLNHMLQQKANRDLLYRRQYGIRCKASRKHSFSPTAFEKKNSNFYTVCWGLFEIMLGDMHFPSFVLESSVILLKTFTILWLPLFFLLMNYDII